LCVTSVFSVSRWLRIVRDTTTRIKKEFAQRNLNQKFTELEICDFSECCFQVVCFRRREFRTNLFRVQLLTRIFRREFKIGVPKHSDLEPNYLLAETNENFASKDP